MAPATQQHSQSIDSILLGMHSLLDCNNTNELRKETLFLMEKVFGAEKSVFFLNRRSNQKIDFNRVVAHGFETKDTRLYRQYYHKLSPAYNSLHKEKYTPKSNVQTIDQTIPYNRLIRTEFYNDYLRPCNVHFEMIIYFRSHYQLIGTIGIWRSSKSAAFTSEDKNKAELMLPILIGALEKAILLEQNNELDGIVNALIQEQPYKGVVVLNDSLEPIYVNENASNIMSISCRQKEGQGNSPLAVLNDVSHHFQAFINSPEMKWISEEGQQPQKIIDIFGQEVLVRVHCLKGTQESPKFLLFLEPKEPIRLLFKNLTDHGLTRRESEIAYQVFQGLTNNEISQKLFISRYTVKNHLRYIFKKMGVSNRTTLVYRLMCLALGVPEHNAS
ncbi:LuxR C-terminal-related transcriptional regulator [Thermodesulfobacteriota bacterium]